MFVWLWLSLVWELAMVGFFRASPAFAYHCCQ
jgi:hypothetical protein